MTEIGYADALLARELADGSLELIDGHARRSLDPEQVVPVLVTDLDEREAAKLLLTLDPLSAMAEADAEALERLLQEVATDDPALQAMLDELATLSDDASLETVAADGAAAPTVPRALADPGAVRERSPAARTFRAVATAGVFLPRVDVVAVQGPRPSSRYQPNGCGPSGVENGSGPTGAHLHPGGMPAISRWLRSGHRAQHGRRRHHRYQGPTRVPTPEGSQRRSVACRSGPSICRPANPGLLRPLRGRSIVFHYGPVNPGLRCATRG